MRAAVKLVRLHEEFLDKARQPMSFGRLPVMPRDADVPLIPTNKWHKDGGLLSKSYQFRLKEQKVEFVKLLLDYELEVGHNATITVGEDSVLVRLQTPGIEKVTELDKEYAKHADELFKDVVYSSSHD